MAGRAAYSRMDYEGGAVETTISSGIGTGDTSISIGVATGWPDGSAGHFFVVVDEGTSSEEKVDVTSRSTLTLTVGARGADGTAAATHSSGATIRPCISAADVDEANYIVSEVTGAANAAGDIVTADGDNSLAALTLGTQGLPLVAGASAPEYAKVDSGGIADGSIDVVHMSANSVDSDQYVDGSIDLVHMSANSVDSDQYVDGSIDLIHMSANSVDSDQYVDGSIDSAHLAADVVDGTKIADDAVDSEHIATGAVDLDHMSANSVDSDQYVDGSIDVAHLSSAVNIRSARFSRSGTLTTGTGTMRMRFEAAVTLVGILLDVETAPTGTTSTPISGQSLVVDVHRSGTTVFTTQANRPTIAESAKQETAVVAPDVTAVSATQYLTCDIDFVGSTVAGADLVVTVQYRLA